MPAERGLLATLVVFFALSISACSDVDDLSLPSLHDCEDECTEGGTRCDGAVVQVCTEDAKSGCLTWGDEVDCGGLAPPELCEMIDGEAVCSPDPCAHECDVLGETTCDETGLVVLTCVHDENADCLVWEETEDCGAEGAICELDGEGAGAFCEYQSDFELILNAVGNGQVFGAGVFAAAADIVIEAVADTGYRFDGWSGDVGSITGFDASEGGAQELQMPAANVTLNAAFEVDTTHFFFLTLNVAGSGEAFGPAQYNAEDEVTISAAADTGHHFVGWTGDWELIDGFDPGVCTEQAVVMPPVDVSLTANFAIGESITNPYGAVDWSQVGHYDGNLHTHTRYSDGGFEPHQVIDEYHTMGYRILALTDHDSHHHQVLEETLYSWGEIEDIWWQIKDQVSPFWGTTWQSASSESWQNRSPGDLGMVAIQGSEISNTHHIGSYFNDYCGGTTSETVALQEIESRGGLSVFFHPGRYSRPVDWYVDYYQQFDTLIGMEVFNQGDRYPGDRELWDKVSHRLMPERAVWGFANDDMHYANHYGRTRNVFLLETLDAPSVRAAMEDGGFYFYVPNVPGQQPGLALENVEVIGDTISLGVAGDYSTINWITFEPRTNTSEIIKTGESIAYAEVPPFSRFVRAQVVGSDGRLYTQPFGITRSEEPELPTYPVTFVVENSQGDPIAGATVLLDGTEAETDAQGQTTFSDTALGTYSYSVSHPDYVHTSGSLYAYLNAVDDDAIVRTIVMETADKVMHIGFEGSLISQEGLVPVTQPAAPNFVPGKAGMGLEIKSSDDYFDFVLDGVLNPAEGTVAFWFQPDYNYDDDSDRRGFWEWYCTSGSRWDNGMIFWTFDSDGANLWNRVDSASHNTISNSYSWQQGQWYHLAVTWSDLDGTMAWFVDGVEQSRGSYTMPTIDPNESIRLHIGSGHSSSNPVDGIIDEFQMYNYAMTETEVADMYADAR